MGKEGKKRLMINVFSERSPQGLKGRGEEGGVERAHTKLLCPCLPTREMREEGRSA